MQNKLHLGTRARFEELERINVSQQIANMELMKDNEGMLTELLRYRTEVTNLKEIINEHKSKVHQQS